MQQLTAALAAPRLLRHARRALLLIGAAFAWWLLFSGGPAQADDGGAAHAVPDPVAPVTRTTKAVTDTLRSAPHRVTDALTATTHRAPKPVRDTVDPVTAALEPSLTETTTTVADAVDGSVAHASDSVRPALQILTAAVAPAPSAPAAQPLGATVSAVRDHRPAASASPPTDARRGALAGFADAPAGDRVAPSEGPGDEAPTTPAVPAAPAVPGGGTTAPAGPLAALGGLLILPPAVRRRRLLGDRTTRPRDPAYSPGCSPD